MDPYLFVSKKTYLFVSKLVLVPYLFVSKRIYSRFLGSLETWASLGTHGNPQESIGIQAATENCGTHGQWGGAIGTHRSAQESIGPPKCATHRASEGDA